MKYSIYIAKIEEEASLKDFLVRVRVMPQMENLKFEELPRWPNFFRKEQITGEVGRPVWVIASDDFSMGYVLGFANFYAWDGDYESVNAPTELFSKVNDVHLELKGEFLSYKNLKITFWNEGSLHFIDRESGAHIIAFRGGTIHIVRGSSISSKVGQSIIEMKGDEIVLSSPMIKIEGEVRLGKNPQGKVFVSSGGAGKNSIPSRDVWG